MTDERCAAGQNLPTGLPTVDLEAAIRQAAWVAAAIDEERCRRVILATLREDVDAKFTVLDQVGECPRCLRGMVGFLANWLASELANGEGGAEIAITTVERQLTDAMARRLEGDK